MFLTTRGLVLRVSNYNDNDALLTLLTEDHGKLAVKARGIKRKNNPLSAPCQLLAYSEFTLFENRGLYSINEAVSVELFHSLRSDLEKLSLGTYFVQVAEVLCQEDSPSPLLLPLVLNCLFALSKLNLNRSLIKSVFELRISCLAGYTPDLTSCPYCGNVFPDRFNLSQGHIECNCCSSTAGEGIRMPITTGTLDSMRYICYCEPKRLFSFQIGDETLLLLSQLTESYLLTQLERGFSTLDFYKTLLL